MKALFIYLNIVMALFARAGEPVGYEIKVKIKGFEGEEIYLAYHYGDKQYILDTARAEKDYFIFKGDEPLKGGIYLVVMPPENIYFELIVSDDQHFSIETDRSDLINKMKVTGSEENRIFYDDLRFINAKRQLAEKLKKKLGQTENPDSTKLLKDQLKAIDEEVKAARESIIRNHPNTLYAKILLAMKEPEVPDPPLNDNGKPDSNFTYLYYKHHYFDNVDFSDDRLLRTPVYHNKIKYYIAKLTPQVPDSLNVACDYLLNKASANDEVFKYTLIWLLNRFANSKIMGMDAVYVHLVLNYYATGKAPWIDSTDLIKMVDRARHLEPILIGKTAPNLILKDLNNQYRSLHQVPSKYTILVFWDPDCGHCKREIPKLKKTYNKLKAAGVDVSVYAVCTELDEKKWRSFIEEHQLFDWINVADLQLQSNFRDLYDIRSTPQIFLLDRKKTILAKRINSEQLGSFIAQKENIPWEKPEDDSGLLKTSDNTTHMGDTGGSPH